MFWHIIIGLLFIWIGGGTEETIGHNVITPALIGAGILVLLTAIFFLPKTIGKNKKELIDENK